MAHDRQVFGSIVLIGFLVFGLMRVADVAPAAANEVLKWNETAVMAATAGGQDGIVTTRTLAMVHGAIHGSLNAINRRYAAYYFEAPAEVGAAPEAAVAAAAHTVLVGVLPSFGTPAQKIAALAIAEDAYMASLSHGSDAAAKTKLSASQFWLPGPPALTSQAYARDYEKVKSLGGQMSTARMAEQTEIALLVRGSPGIQSHRPCCGRGAWPQCLGQRPAPGPHEHDNGGRLYRRLQDPLRV